jgi:hypothetical protein
MPAVRGRRSRTIHETADAPFEFIVGRRLRKQQETPYELDSQLDSESGRATRVDVS